MTKKLTMRQYRFIVTIFFGVLLLTGLRVYQDYGISFDEHASRLRGGLNGLYANYKLEHMIIPEAKVDQMLLSINDTPDQQYTETSLLQFDARDHGAFFDLVLIGIEAALGLKQSHEIYRARHLVTFLFYWLSLIVFYFFLRDLKIPPLWSILGVTLLFLSPRIFANSFYNMKDLAFLSSYILAGFTALRFLQNINFRWAILHAIACAIAIDIRIPGVITPFITLLILAVSQVKQPKGVQKKAVMPVAVYLSFLILFIVVFWPVLWEAPIKNFLYSFQRLGAFPGHKSMYFFGDTVFSDAIPWYYIPGWMLITTPTFYWVAFIIGCLAVVKQLKPFDFKNLGLWLVILFGFLPLLVIMIRSSKLYDGWRHLYFIYPFIIVIILMGFKYAHDLLARLRQPLAKIFIGVIVIVLVSLCHKIYQLHPFQHSYFNLLAGKNINKRFITDYWGLAYKQGFEFLLQHTDQPKLDTFVPFEKGPAKSDILPYGDKNRFNFVPADQAEFLMIQPLSFSNDLTREHIDLKNYDKVFGQAVDGVEIFWIYQKSKRYK